MKKRVKSILVILISCLVISGCVQTKPESYIKITKIMTYVQCPVPDEPVYGEFSDEIHLGHLGNLEMMRFNLEKALRYNDSLKNTVNCYEFQTLPEGGGTNE